MDSTLLSILLLLVGLAGGFMAGWLLANRAVVEWRARHEARDAEARELEGKFLKTFAELEASKERANRVDSLEGELTGARERVSLLSAKIAAFERGEDERQRAHEAQLAQLKEFGGNIESKFQELAGRALEGAHDVFLKRAEEKFGKAGEKNAEQIRTLLLPVESTLKRYEDNLARVEKEREGSYRELNRAVGELSQGTQIVRQETQRLANVMTSSPKARGRWGEEQTQTILETAGLRENIDFVKQKSVHDGDGVLRPDFIVNLPGNRCIVIDVKCPLVAFEQAFDEEDDERRATYLLKHANALKSYASDLGKKGYWRQFEKSPEFVIMFIPGEHHLAAAAERAPDLIQDAFKDGVVIASTINLLALSKIMAGMWRQETLREQAKEIADLGRELFRSLGILSEHVARLGKNLGTATAAYNDMIGSLEGNVYRGARDLAALGVESGGKKILPAPTVDKAIRPLIKLAVSEQLSVGGAFPPA